MDLRVLIPRHLNCYPKTLAFVTLLIFFKFELSNQQLAPEVSSQLNTDPFYLDLFHKFTSEADFRPRGSILVKPRTEHRPAQATFTSQNQLDRGELNRFRIAYQNNEDYYLKAVYRSKKQDSDSVYPVKTTQTVVKSCSLFVTNLTDTLTININPNNDFISVNLHTSDPECLNIASEELSTNQFRTSISIEQGTIGPQPDTVTYIKRLEEERLNKLKEGKEDNRSFLAKYWMYIVPGVIILMMMSGPEAQGAR